MSEKRGWAWVNGAVVLVAAFAAAGPAAGSANGAQCLPFEPPDHAQVAGNSWICEKGYYRDADASGHSWYCRNGFKQAGQACVPVDPPENARILGNGWVCKDGYSEARP